MVNNNDIFSKNLVALQNKDLELASSIQRVSSNSFYSDILYAKDGSIVPRYYNGNAAHSLYDPIKEASRILETIDYNSCVLFCGIGAGYHIRKWLESSPLRPCILLEANVATLRSLLDICDISDILTHDSIRIITDPLKDELYRVISETWKPALEKSFKVITLRSWENLQKNIVKDISDSVSNALRLVSTDLSVQSHFGRLWMRNALRNLSVAEKFQGRFPKVDTNKTALIIAAGPSLESSISQLIQNRNLYTVFATDTSYSFLVQKNIIPDFFVSIDAQQVSISHIMSPLHSGMTIVLDATAHPGIARKAIECGCNLIIGCGGHPLPSYASNMTALPNLSTGSGTVTGTALGVAQSLGFTKITLLGADFQYTDGKAYVRGTYLDDRSFLHSNRFYPSESFWTELLFRTPVTRICKNGSISYTTEILEQYAKEVHSKKNINLWSKKDFNLFPFQEFIANLQYEYSKIQYPDSRNKKSFFTLLPFIAWHNHSQRTNNITCPAHEAINLALELIAGYT